MQLLLKLHECTRYTISAHITVNESVGVFLQLLKMIKSNDPMKSLQYFSYPSYLNSSGNFWIT